MLQSYDDKMKQTKWKRDRALARMRLAKIQATSAIERNVTQKVDALKCEYHRKVDNLVAKIDPNNVVRKHPWGAALGMAGLGLLLVPLFRRAIFVPVSRTKHAAPPPQRVVVEVVGTPQPKARKASAFSGIVDAALHSLPGLVSFAQAHFANMQQHSDGNGKGSMAEPAAETAVATTPAPAAATAPVPPAKPAQPQAKHPSISRRTAPPPQQ